MHLDDVKIFIHGLKYTYAQKRITVCRAKRHTLTLAYVIEYYSTPVLHYYSFIRMYNIQYYGPMMC